MLIFDSVFYHGNFDPAMYNVRKNVSVSLLSTAIDKKTIYFYNEPIKRAGVLPRLFQFPQGACYDTF